MELLHFAQKQKLWSFTLSSASFFVRFDFVFLLRASAIFKLDIALGLSSVGFVFLLLTRDSSSKLGSPLARSSVAP